ncbi:DUF370 domain-containing protein, partial [Dysosmobacter welbionis]
RLPGIRPAFSPKAARIPNRRIWICRKSAPGAIQAVLPVSLPGRFRSSSDAGPMTASRRRMIRSSHLNPYPSAGCWSHRLMQASRRSSV